MRANFLTFMAATSAALVLSACGGGGSTTVTPAADTLGGVAAVGSPIVGGTINVSCAGGSALASTTTSSTGAWQVTLSGQTLPCAVQVSGGTINSVLNTTPYHSIALSAGTVNVTPLTDLLIANLALSTTPGTWFSGLTPSTLTAINQSGVNAALNQLRTALPGLTPLNTINPITTVFTPTPGNNVDDMLEALKTAITANVGSTYATLLSSAAQSTFTAPGGLSAALTTAYLGTTSGGGITIPAIPGGVSATAASSTQINVNWTNVSGASAYNIYRSTSASVQIVAGNKINTTAVTAGPFQNPGLSASTTYYYKVTAANTAGETVGSTEVSATTTAAGVITPTISSFSPSSGAVGATVTLTGTNFSTTAASNTVNFNGVSATVTNATATQLTVTVPSTASTGNITVAVGGQTATSATGFTVSGAGGGGSGTAVSATFLAISSGDKHTCGLNTSGAAYCWGENGAKALGDGTTTDHLTPVAVQGGLTFSSISAEEHLSCGVTAAGALYCWGYGAGGQFGHAATPTPAAPGITFASISVGRDHICGVATDGTGYCMGSNAGGLLGSGQAQAALSSSATFLPVAGGLTWKQISTSTIATCGITTAGALYCWGNTSLLAASSATPVLISNAVAFESISPHITTTQACGLLAGGEAYCVGSDLSDFGGTAGATPQTPVRVGGTSTFKSLAHFGDNLCGVATSNALYCWGNNGRGELGQGSTPGQSTTPLVVMAGTNFSAVSIGDEESVCAVTSAGVGYCWGYNFYGQIGDGTVFSRNTPTAISGGITFRAP